VGDWRSGDAGECIFGCGVADACGDAGAGVHTDGIFVFVLFEAWEAGITDFGPGRYGKAAGCST